MTEEYSWYFAGSGGTRNAAIVARSRLMDTSSRGLAVAVLSVLWLLTGCGHVRPWEREDLARVERHLDGDDAARGYEAHMWMVREGAAGGTGKPGGGCGCN